MARLKIDERVYDNADVTIALLGDIPAGVTDMEYDSETAHNKIFAAGSRKPVAYTMGKEEASASITLVMPDVVRIEDQIEGEKKLTRIKPFWITVTYTNEYYKTVVDKLLVKFQNQGRKTNTEDGLAREFNLFTLDIKYNVTD